MGKWGEASFLEMPCMVQAACLSHGVGMCECGSCRGTEMPGSKGAAMPCVVVVLFQAGGKAAKCYGGSGVGWGWGWGQAGRSGRGGGGVWEVVGVLLSLLTALGRVGVGSGQRATGVQAGR